MTLAEQIEQTPDRLRFQRVLRSSREPRRSDDPTQKSSFTQRAPESKALTQVVIPSPAITHLATGIQASLLQRLPIPIEPSWLQAIVLRHLPAIHDPSIGPSFEQQFTEFPRHKFTFCTKGASDYSKKHHLEQSVDQIRQVIFESISLIEGIYIDYAPDPEIQGYEHILIRASLRINYSDAIPLEEHLYDILEERLPEHVLSHFVVMIEPTDE